jgi:Stress responsive A/B Barrel Domain
MIKHIVMWRLFDFAEGNTKKENALKLKEKLISLPDKIPQIKKMEVGINVDGTDAASDVVLYCEFDSLEDLKAYQIHPEHQKVVGFLNKVRSEKRGVDYEV